MSQANSTSHVIQHDEVTKKEFNDLTLEPVPTKGEAGVGEIEETRNGQFHRSFSPRQVHVRIQC